MWYKLDVNHNPVPCGVDEADKLLGSDECRVGLDYIEEYMISTVFLVLGHGFEGEPPLLFETMITAKGEFLDF